MATPSPCASELEQTSRVRGKMRAWCCGTLPGPATHPDEYSLAVLHVQGDAEPPKRPKSAFLCFLSHYRCAESPRGFNALVMFYCEL